MNATASFPEDALTIEQWQLLEGLAQTLNPAQARWVSGYFAGFQSGLGRGGSVVSAVTGQSLSTAPTVAARTLTILYGSETGNARELAKSLSAAADAAGLSSEIADMADYKPRRLKDAQDILVIVSTHGEGDPPQTATGFFEFVEGHRAPRLEGVRFALLALGDSTYEKYCEAGKRLDSRLAELGAQRLRERVDCDVDYDDAASLWGAELTALFTVDAAAVASSHAATPKTAGAQTLHDKQNPFAATLLENIPIVGGASTKQTRHLELDISGSGLTYQPGDALGVVAANDPVVVEAIIAATGLDEDASVLVKGETLALSQALEHYYEVAAASPRFLTQWAELSGAETLKKLGEVDAAAERIAFLRDHHPVDIIRRFPATGIEAKDFLAGLRPIQPRLYSLASSLSAVPDEAHLTLAPVRYNLHGQARNGVASSLLADRIEPGSRLPVYIQENPQFRLPASDAPIIMVGAGTGVAPFRAFMQEREATGIGGPSWLFFGERNFRSDFLYQTEWQAWLKAETLSRMDVAFSRDDAGKVYVQHRMRENAAALFAWLEDGAHFYVCGDAAAMAHDVNEALVELIAEEGGFGRDAAEDYVRRLIADHRYQRDVY